MRQALSGPLKAKGFLTRYQLPIDSPRLIRLEQDVTAHKIVRVGIRSVA